MSKLLGASDTLCSTIIETKASVSRILLFAIDRCQPGRVLSNSSFVDMQRAALAISALQTHLTTPRFLGGVQSFIDEVGIPDWWCLDLFGSDIPGARTENCSNKEACPFEFEKCRLQLSSDVSSLLIEGGWQVSCHDPRKQPHASETLHKLLWQLTHAKLADSRLRCSHLGEMKDKIHFRDLGAERSCETSACGWKDALALDLVEATARSHNLVTRHVDSVCRDLETRCATVEEQLQKAQKRAAELDMDLKAANVDLEIAVLENVELRKRLGQEADFRDLEIRQMICLQNRLAAAHEQKLALTNAVAERDNRLARRVHEIQVMQDAADQAAEAQDVAHQAELQLIKQELISQKKRAAQLELNAEWFGRQQEESFHKQEEMHNAEIALLKHTNSLALLDASEEVCCSCCVLLRFEVY